MDLFKQTGDIKKEFPQLNQAKGQSLSPLYFDSASTTLKPRVVLETIENIYSYVTGNVHRGGHRVSEEATLLYESARRTVARFINAENEEVIFTSGTTDSINLLASSYADQFLTKGDEIILSEMEHHSNIVPWQLAAQKIGFNVKYIPVTSKGELDLEVYKSMLSEKTKFVGLTYCSNTLGTVNPVQKITALAKERSAHVFIDAAQAITHLSCDVKEIGCDFLAFSGHKAFAATGIGVLWGRKELLDQMPPYRSGGSMIDKVTLEGTTFAPVPQKFEAGTPHIVGAISLATAINFMVDYGKDKIGKEEKKLLVYLEDKLKEIPGVQIIGTSDSKVNVCSFIVKDIHNSDIVTLLNEQGIAVRGGHHCTQPLMKALGIEGTIRVSLSIYNNKQDIDKLVTALSKAIEIVK